jgi:hypothetical protein
MRTNVTGAVVFFAAVLLGASCSTQQLSSNSSDKYYLAYNRQALYVLQLSRLAPNLSGSYTVYASSRQNGSSSISTYAYGVSGALRGSTGFITLSHGSQLCSRWKLVSESARLDMVIQVKHKNIRLGIVPREVMQSDLADLSQTSKAEVQQGTLPVRGRYDPDLVPPCGGSRRTRTL